MNRKLGSLGQPLNSDAGLTPSKEESGLREVGWKSPSLQYSSRKVQEGYWGGPLAKVTCLRSPVSPRSGSALVSPLGGWAVWLWCHCSDEFQNATAEAVGQWRSLWEEI